MAVPVDVRDLVKTSAALVRDRERELGLAIVLELDAPDALVDAVRETVRPVTASASLQVEAIEPCRTLAIRPGTDALIAVAGGTSTDLKDLLRAVRTVHLPAVVIALGGGSLADDLAALLEHPRADVVVDDDPRRLLEDRLAAWLAEELPTKRLALAHNLPFTRRAVAEEAVRTTAWQNALIGAAAFLPGADMPIMTANQAKMLLRIAAAYGGPLGPERVKELLAVVGGGLLFRGVARQALGLVPVLGWAVKGGVGYGGTIAMGKAAIAYFERGADLGAVVAGLRSGGRPSALVRDAGE